MAIIAAALSAAGAAKSGNPWARLRHSSPFSSRQSRVISRITDSPNRSDFSETERRRIHRTIAAAERQGLLRKGGTIVEPTSGNTGHALAIAAAIKGYRMIFVMADKQSPEKVALLRAYGAEVVICPTAVPRDSPESYYSVAERLSREIPGAFQPNQYFNPENPRSHYLTTGPEIWEQTEGKVDVVVAGLGTGGTMTGVGRYLKEK